MILFLQESFKDNAAVEEALERFTYIADINQEVEGLNHEKRPLSSIRNEVGRRKRSATPQNRKY